MQEDKGGWLFLISLIYSQSSLKESISSQERTEWEARRAQVSIVLGPKHGCATRPIQLPPKMPSNSAALLESRLQCTKRPCS